MTAITGTTSPPARNRGLAFVLLCAATLMIILDGTIVTVALPSIQRGLGFSAGGLTWVMNAYLIAFAGLLLLAGRLGDLLGRKRTFLAGLALFTAASLACGLATSPGMLIAARFAQGAGGALIAAVSLGMITTLYPEPPEQARAIGAYSAMGAAGASVGLILGGVLTQGLGWQWVFFVNLPIGAAAGAASAWVLAPDRGSGLRRGADGLGALLVTGGLMLGVDAIIQAGGYGWASARTLGFAAAAVILLAGFTVRQARAAVPLLPLRILASRGVAGANLAQVLAIAAAFGFQVLITQDLQWASGFGPAAAGLAIVPTALVIGSISLVLAARLGSRFGHRAVLLAGLALIAAAFALLTRAPAGGSYLTSILPAMLILGAGGGLTLPALANLAMAGATPADAGVTSGLFNTSQQVGAALGVAVLSTLAAGRTAHLRAACLPHGAALTGGYHLAFGVGAALAAAALVVAAVMLRTTRPAPAAAGIVPERERAERERIRR